MLLVLDSPLHTTKYYLELNDLSKAVMLNVCISLYLFHRGWLWVEDTPMENADDGKPDEVVQPDETDRGGISHCLLVNIP